MTYKNTSQLANSSTANTTPTNFPVIDKRDPTPNDIYYPIGKFWINQASARLWYLNTQSNISGVLQSTWELISVSSILVSLSDTVNNVVFPSSNSDIPPDNIQFIGGPGITVVGNDTTHTMTITAVGAGFETLSGNIGGPVGPDGSGNIKTIGGTTIYVTGVPLSNQLTYDVVSAANTILVGTGTTTASVPITAGLTNQALIGHTGSAPTFGQIPNGALVNSSVTLNNGNNITVTGGTPLSLGGTASFNLTGTTNHDVQIGNASGSLTSVTNGTTGQVLTANTGADPTWQNAGSSSVTFTGDSGTPFTGNAVTVTGDSTGLTFTASTPNLTLGGALNVAHGGTGDTSFTAYMPIVGGTTTTNPLQSVVTGVAGQVLTYVSSSAIPTWQNASAGTLTGLIPDTFTAPGTSPVVPNGSGNITIKGGPLYGTGTNPDAVRTDSLAANAMNIELQLAGANAGSSTPNNFGVAQFNSTNFGVTAGFVSANNFTINTIGGLTGGGSITLGGTLTISGSASSVTYTNVNHAASPYTVTASDQYLSCDTSAGTVILLFPNSTTASRTWIIKDRLGTSATSNISITTVGGGDTIDGQTTYKIASNYGAVQMLFNSISYELY